MATQDPPSDSTTGIQSLAENPSLANPNPTFTLFPKLAPELRLKILKHALPFNRKGRRFIEVRARIGAPSRHSKEPCWFILDDNAYSSDVKDMGLLGANKESRDAYLRYFNKSLKVKGQGLIRYQEDDIIYVANIDILMLSDSMRSAITDGSRIEHLFNSCINIAAPIRYFIDYHDNYTKWFGDDAHLCPLTVVSQFKKLKTVAAVLSESDEEKFFAAIGVTPKVLHARWWCYLSHAEIQMRQCKEEEEVGSGKTAPELLLMSDDGEMVKGKKCTEKKCFNE